MEPATATEAKPAQPEPTIPADVSVDHALEQIVRPAVTETCHRITLTRTSGQRVSLVGESYHRRDQVLAKALELLQRSEAVAEEV